jgi:hypothetical protein
MRPPACFTDPVPETALLSEEIAGRPDELVFITEDPAGAAALRRFGVLAMARPIGGAWSTREVAPLVGRDVAILQTEPFGHSNGWCERDRRELAHTARRVGIITPDAFEGVNSPDGLAGFVAQLTGFGFGPSGFVAECLAKLEDTAPRVDPPSANGRRDEVDADEPIAARSWPAPPDAAVYHGLAGEIVRVIEPQTEADPLGLLIQLLVMFGNVIGRSPHFVVEATSHHANEYTVLVGQSAQGRKGTSADRVRELFASIDAGWLNDQIKGGLSSGEGLISAVRDPVWEKRPVKEKGRVKDYENVMIDGGVEDKRLLVLETEFGGALRALEREGNKLSALIRQGWDHGNLATLTKSPFQATNAHISIIGHITAEELLGLLSRIDVANGFANRFLWAAVRRSNVLPFGGKPLDLSPLTGRLADAADFARDVGRMSMDFGARALWERHYERLTTPPPGVLGAVTSRGAPHALRLAILYALMDRTGVIADDHLGAALALWEASARCAAYIFGDSLGNPDAERILAALRLAPGGLTRAEIREGVFQRNVSSDRIKAALALLLRNHLIREERDDATGGRPSCRYYAINAVNAKSPPLWR